MKKLQAPIAGLIILLAAASCKKDLQQNQMPEQAIETSQATVANSAPEGISESEWQTSSSWTAVERPTHSVFYTDIKADISSETAEQGLIRIVKTSNSGNTVQSLPFEETVNGNKYYWYYQVTEGNVMIAVDVYGSKSNPAQGSLFKSVVLTKEAISGHEAKGNTKAELMSMPVEEITGK